MHHAALETRMTTIAPPDRQPLGGRHLDDDELVLHYYGELDAAAETMAATHVSACGGCHARYTRLLRVMAAVDSLPAPALPNGFERTVWARLEPALPRRHTWFSRLFIAPPNLAWAATIVLLVAAAFFAGRLTGPHQERTTALLTAEQVREGVLLSDLSEHLDRSQTMLVELVAGAEGGSPSDIDLSIERGRAQELVAANRLYRQTASETGDVTITEVLDDLERLLVELAAAPDHPSAEDVARVKARVAANDLLFKVRVVSSAVRERQKEQIRTRTQERHAKG
jgi:hypothetical protein